MKTGRVTVFTIAALVFCFAGISRAQGGEDKLISKVPFDFIVGDSRLPAGDYVVTETEDPGVVAVSSKDGRYHVLVLTIPYDGPDYAPANLVFHEYDGQHFLERIGGGGVAPREIPLSTSTMDRSVQEVAAQPQPQQTPQR